MNATPAAAMKWTYLTRTLPHGTAMAAGARRRPPRPGDLVIARVVEIGAVDHVENRNGRRMRLHEGDVVVGALGNHYATDGHEAYVLDATEAHLLTTGGLMGSVVSTHELREPTCVEIIAGLVGGGGEPLSTEDFARPAPARPIRRPATIAVVGSAAGSGKTETAVGLIRGWAHAGLRAGAGRVTGSDGARERWEYLDAGASAVADFLDFGMASTFGQPGDRLAATMLAIRDFLAGDGAEAVVLEVSDGLLMPETTRLLRALVGEVDGVILAANDALAARAGAAVLQELGLPLRALSGQLTRSALAAREALRATGLPVLSVAELAAGEAPDVVPAAGTGS